MIAKPVWINARALEFLHDESLALFGGSSGMRDESLYQSAMARAQNLFAYEENCSIAQMAAAYCYGLAKNHPFVDGNKRAAFLSIGLFLGLNGFRLQVDQVEAIQITLGVASSQVTEEQLADWVEKNMNALSVEK